MSEPTNPELYEKVKKEIRKKYGKPSAYASGATVQEYKRRGGKYKGKKTQDLNEAIDAVGGGFQDKIRQYNIKKYGNPEGTRALGGALQAEDLNNFVNASYDKKGVAPTDINGYILDKELSSGDAKVYHHPETKHTIVANRGTQGTLQDWANNLAYTMGMYDRTGRWKNAERIQDEAIKKYGKVDANVGHSQSGIITRKLNDLGKTGEVINVNPASLGEKQRENETVVRSTLDPVSFFQPNKEDRNVSIKARSYNPFTEHSGNILGRLNPRQLIGI